MITHWLDDVKNNIVKKAAKIFATVVSVLQKPEYRRAAKTKIKETARPAVSELLRRHTERPAYEHAASRRKNDLGR